MDPVWKKIALLWLTGVVAAAQLAKFSALAPVLRVMFGLDLVQVSMLISLLEVGGAVFGFIAGLALGRIGSRMAMLWGLSVLGGASLIESVAPGSIVLFPIRAVEGLGYLLVVIGAPTLIATLAQDGPRRGQAMMLWGTFVPVGMGLGSALTGVVATAWGPRMAIGLWALPCVLALPVVARMPGPPALAARRMLPALPAWLLAAGFGVYTLSVCALTGLLPTFLVERHGASLASASLVTGMVALAALPGTALAMAILRRADHGRNLPCLMLVAAGLLSPWIYCATGLIVGAVLAVTVVILTGPVRSFIFARLPTLSGASHLSDPRIPAAQGLLTQCGASGALLGPPLGGWIVEHWGWDGLGLMICGLTLVLAAVYVAADTLGRQSSPQRID